MQKFMVEPNLIRKAHQSLQVFVPLSIIRFSLNHVADLNSEHKGTHNIRFGLNHVASLNSEHKKGQMIVRVTAYLGSICSTYRFIKRMNLMWLKIKNCRSKVGKQFRNKWFVLADLGNSRKYKKNGHVTGEYCIV